MFVDQPAQTIHLRRTDAPQTPEVLGVAPAFEVSAEYFAEESRLCHRGAELQRGNALPETPGAHPADAETRRQRLGVGGADDHPAVAVESLHRRLQRRGVLEFGVQGVFDDRHAIGPGQLGQPSFRCLGHAGAKRVMNVRHGDDGLDAFFGKQQFERVERDTAIGVGGHLDGAQAKMVDQRDEVEIGRRLDGDRVPGASHTA